MNVVNKRKSSATGLRALQIGTLALVLCAAMPNAWAKQRKPNPSQDVMVVAHIPFDGKSSKDMSIQTQSNGRRYLYVEHSPEQGVSVLDIAKPSEPKLVGSIAWPDATTTHMTHVTGEAVLLTEGAASSASASTQAGDDPVVLWDTSQPKSPKVVQRFDKVVKVLSDDFGYVYVLNTEGLWVISTPAAESEFRRMDPDAPQNHIEYGGG